MMFIYLEFKKGMFIVVLDNLEVMELEGKEELGW